MMLSNQPLLLNNLSLTIDFIRLLIYNIKKTIKACI